ncbi:hypothetical protein Hanom_Chr07g00626691 [Helianthus anomalus]
MPSLCSPASPSASLVHSPLVYPAAPVSINHLSPHAHVTTYITQQTKRFQILPEGPL